MRANKLIFISVLTVAFLALMSGAQAAHWISGTVNDAADSTPANGHKVIIYYLGDQAHNVSDTIGPAGMSGTSNMYMCDAESIPGHVWAPGDVIYAKVIDTGDGYTAGPVSVTTTGAGFDTEPTMTLEIWVPPPIVAEPQASPSQISINTGVTELSVKVYKTSYDIDTVTVNLSQIGGLSNHMMSLKEVINATASIYNCTTNSSVEGTFSLPVNATDIYGNSNTSVSISLEVTSAIQIQYNLVKKPGSTGKNWISIPLETNITTASQLMSAIGSNCDAVNRWNPVTQKSEGWISLFGGMGTNFAIVPGEGYEVSVTANTTFSVLGTIPTTQSINLVKKPGSTGKNWVGLPYFTTKSNASQLMSSIGSNCDAVNRWNPVTQKSEGWISLFGGMGTNFNITTGAGYEVSVTGNTTWMPT
ncbi:MAG: hypothetical protein PHD13_03235 [Methanocellales archaeon]|nr:hypothetical protein [Methanocellales archaeon]MDD3291602.1 hypothetical protein [Methanocellales archaeon]MDD5235171.1 hypothetical protein [Methanocellales archaeon]MDD5485385.1 hypothetical protein [Methanocellales archaeon]